MKKKNLADLSDAKLLEQAKSIRIVTGILGGALIVQLLLGLYLLYDKGFSVFIVLPFAMLPIVFLNLNTHREIKKELERRRNQT